MDELVFSLVILLLVGIVVIAPSSLLDFLNRKAISASKTARKALVLRARSLDSNDIDDFLAKSGLTREDTDAGYTLLRFLAELLQVPPEKLARNYEMRELFSYSESVAPEGNEPPPKEIQPFAYDLVDGIAELSDKKLWKQKWKDTPGFPLGGEDALADFIMRMTVTDLLRFFAPLTKTKRS